MDMKKFLVMLMFAVVMSAFVGCATVRLTDGASIVGDVPKAGQLIEVVETISYETSGPAETVVVWRLYSSDDMGETKTFKSIGCRPANLRGKGIYLVEKDVETHIDFTLIDRLLMRIEQ
jgi:hypothetical protein